jgi:hypothetical protein
MIRALALRSSGTARPAPKVVSRRPLIAAPAIDEMIGVRHSARSGLPGQESDLPQALQHTGQRLAAETTLEGVIGLLGAFHPCLLDTALPFTQEKCGSGPPSYP